MLLLASVAKRSYTCDMKNLIAGMRVGIVVLCVSLMPTANCHAQALLLPELYIREVKITGEEFLVIQATQTIADLSEYWIGYSSSETTANIVPSQQLPARALQNGQAILLTSDGGATCDAVWTTRLAPSLGDTRGTLVLRKLQSSGASSTFTTVDQVTWAKPAASATTSALLDLRKETASNAYPVWYRDASITNGVWRVGSMNGCVVSLLPTTTLPATEITWTTTAVEPPAVIESLTDTQEVSDENEVSVNPNAGLAPPMITELLPNPFGTGTDATDEFIELYNSNDEVFDLSGFTLQTGTTTKHNYTFPRGTLLAAKSFGVYSALQTGLSMSNTNGQAALLDSSRAPVSSTEPYISADDGMTWALAQGEWYWTSRATPGETNVIVQAVTASLAKTGVASAGSVLAAKTTKATVVKAAKTVKTKTTLKKAAKTKVPATKATLTTQPVASAATKPTKIHWGVLAVVATGAVGYGLYAYRHDIATTAYNLRANRATRRTHRS